MRIDLPQCGFHYCRFQFDGNCTSTGKYEKCEYRYLSEQIEPGRKKGKWNTYYHSDIEFSHSCNQCGYSAPYQMIGGEVFQKKWNFCPNCGSYNGGEQE